MLNVCIGNVLNVFIENICVCVLLSHLLPVLNVKATHLFPGHLNDKWFKNLNVKWFKKQATFSQAQTKVPS